MFNAEEFMQQQLPAGPTQFKPVPVAEYNAVVEKLDTKSGIGKTGSPWARIDVYWKIDDPALLANGFGRATASVRQGIMLDLTESGDFDATGNVNFNRFRDVFGLNDGGKATGEAVGKMARIRIAHRPDKDDATKIYTDVAGVARL